MERLSTNRERVLHQIEVACRRAGRDPAQVSLLAVTKSVEPAVAAALVALGSTELGENRAPELERKAAWFAAHGVAANWHFIGHLQRNKARRVVRLASKIHSVDTLALVRALARIGREENRSPGIYLQVKIADEAEKYGFDPEAVPGAVEEIASDGSLRLEGLMTMAPLLPDPEAARRAAFETFSSLAALGATLPSDAFQGGRPLLSMGMSGDYEEAIRAGAHVVRIGSALFEGIREGLPLAEGSGGDGEPT